MRARQEGTGCSQNSVKSRKKRRQIKEEKSSPRDRHSCRNVQTESPENFLRTRGEDEHSHCLLARRAGPKRQQISPPDPTVLPFPKNTNALFNSAQQVGDSRSIAVETRTTTPALSQDSQPRVPRVNSRAGSARRGSRAIKCTAGEPATELRRLSPLPDGEPCPHGGLFGSCLSSISIIFSDLPSARCYHADSELFSSKRRHRTRPAPRTNAVKT